MPNIFESLESALQGNGVAGSLTAATGSLTGVGSLISGTGKNPPSSISGFGPALRALPAPNLDVSGAFAPSFASISGAIPKDLSSVTGGLTAGLDKLKGSVGGDITSKLGESLTSIQSIYQLTQLDFHGTGAPQAQGQGQGQGQGGAPAGPPVSAQAANQLHSALGGLPTPLTVDSFLTWLQQAISEAKLDDFGLRQLLIVGELRDYLDTLIHWKQADPDALRTHLAGTLASLDSFLRQPLDSVWLPLESSGAALAGKLHGTELAQIADGAVERLKELQPLVAGGSLIGAGASITALTALLDQYDALKPGLQADVLAALPDFQSLASDLPDDLDDQIGRIASALRPGNTLGLFDKLAADVRAAGVQKPVDDLKHFLERLVSWLDDLLSKIDLAALTQPMKQAAGAAKSAVDGLDDAMAAVTLQVKDIFGKVEAALNLLDPAGVTTQVKAAIDAFKTNLAKSVTELLKPVLDALNKIVDTISKGVKTFDPNQIKALLHNAISKIAGVLNDPKVGDVRKTLDNAAKQLDVFSFAPFTDEVIKDMQQITNTLKSLGESPLGPAMDSALHAALSVLPEKLTPITDPLLDEFGKAVDAGPVQVLDSLADLPKQLVDKVRAFDPNSLVGDALEKPYGDLLHSMEGFRPSSLLEPVKQELAGLKDRLKQNVSPGASLGSLHAPFENLKKSFDALHPDELIAPLEAKLKEVLNSLSVTLPLDDVFAQVDAAMQSVKSVLDTATSFTNLIDRIRGILDAFANPKAQLDAWLAPTLAKFDSLGDTSALQASLASISASVGTLSAAALVVRRDAALAPMTTVLDTLDPQKRLTAVLQAYRAISPATVDALPGSPQKAALKTALGRLDPMQEAFARPFQAMAAAKQNLAQAKADFQTATTDWDSRYMGPDGPLGGLQHLDPSPAHLKSWVQEAVDEGLTKPLTALFSLADPAKQIFDAVSTQLSKIVNDVQAKVAELLQGVTALTTIRDALKQLLDRLKNFNLGFLRDNLKDLFATLKAKLAALDPAQLGKALDAAFAQALDTISVDLFLPPAAVAEVDADYAKLVDTLKSLDPKNVIAQIVQDEFEKDVLPLLDIFDMTQPLHQIAERLKGLAEELKTELGRVEGAFESMRGAIPAGAGV